jgi:hypothetical protein
MINKFKNFKYIEESYLDSNFDPLYHKTTTYDFYKIIEENTLRTTKIPHPFKKELIKMVSLTRNPNLDLSYFKLFLDVIIELDRDILIKNHIIHTGKEKFPKSNILRKDPFENEEIILSDINNITDFIISVNFKNDSIIDKQVAMIIPILRKNNIKIYNNGKIF